MPGPFAQGEESWTESRARSLVDRIAPKLAIVTDTYPSTADNDSNYYVDLKVTGDLPALATTGMGSNSGNGNDTNTDSEVGAGTPLVEAGAVYSRVNVSLTMTGEGRGLQVGEQVTVAFLDGVSEDPTIVGAHYHDSNEAIEIEEGDWRNKFGDAIVDIIEDGSEIQIGSQSGVRGELDTGLYINTTDNGVELFDDTGTGICIRNGSYYHPGIGSYLADSGTAGSGTTGGAGGADGDTVSGGFPAPTGGQPAPSDLSLQNWTPVFEDTFDGSSTASIAEVGTQAVSGLDTRKWSVGFGWGTGTDTSAESIAEENIRIENGNLVLNASHDNGSNITAGCINTRGKAAYGPGHYWEARIKMPDREGFLPAFWSKPDSEAWPPEIDFVEILGDIDTTAHHVHYVQGGGSPGGDHGDWCDGCNNRTSTDFSASFHVFGCAWESDRIRWWVDNQQVHEVTEENVLESCRKGAPFYTMLNIHIDKNGTTNKSVSWPEEMVVDYMRVFERIGG